MFYTRTDALLLSEAGLLGLRLSLNTPVVQVDELPGGPARAAIVLHAGEYGSAGLTVALRSVGGPHTVLYSYRGPVEGPDALESAWNAALAFTEAMGFLFEDETSLDDEEARHAAFARWQLFCGPSLDAPSGEFGDAALEIDPHEGEHDLDLEGAPEAPGAAPPRAPRLSKFRQPEARRPARARRTAEPAAAPNGSALGRVPIVKRRAEPDAPEAPHPLLEVLSSF